MNPVPIPPKLMSQLGIDLMRMKPTNKGMNYIISAVDYFTKYCELGALPNKDEHTVATCIYMTTYSAGTFDFTTILI